MPDNRPLTEKLRAMAEQDESPFEAENARRLLAMGAGGKEPPQRPPVPGFSFEDFQGAVHRWQRSYNVQVRMAQTYTTSSATFYVGWDND